MGPFVGGHRFLRAPNHDKFSLYTPSELSRRPRDPSLFHAFKATWFRHFLLYTGVMFMRGLVIEQTYHHFLCLSMAYRILSSKNNSDLNCFGIAQQLLNLFVKEFKSHYNRNLTYYIHGLLQLAECAEHFCSLLVLKEYSAYKYENSILKL